MGEVGGHAANRWTGGEAQGEIAGDGSVAAPLATFTPPPSTDGGVTTSLPLSSTASTGALGGAAATNANVKAQISGELVKKPGAVPVPETEGGADGEGAAGGAVLARPTGVSAVGNHLTPPTAAGRSGPGTDASMLARTLKMGAVREAWGVHESGGEQQRRRVLGWVGQGKKSSDCVAAI